MPFFRHHLKGDGRRDLPRPGSSRPAPTAGASSRPGRPRTLRARLASISAQTAPSASNRRQRRGTRPSTSTVATRRSRCPTRPRSRPAGTPSTWSRTSASPPGARTCWSTGQPVARRGSDARRSARRRSSGSRPPASDADWVVKLIDEYPGRLPGCDPDSEEPDLGGTQQMVRSEALRGRFRSELRAPRALRARRGRPGRARRCRTCCTPSNAATGS